jgi:branched-chain amino acid aminotransferase
LNSLLAFLEAADENAGYDDALLCNAEGHLTEGTTFNIFYVGRGIVCTPPLDIGILDGITRRKTIEVARDLGFEVREVRFPKERLYEADEVFMTSTIKEVFPVTRVDRKVIADGKPGPITVQLAEAFRRSI